MNDKQQLAAMGDELSLTEEQAKELAKELVERMPRTGVLQVIDDEPLCMAKRIDELEAHVRVMAGLLREAVAWMDDHPAMPDSSMMHAALSGTIQHPAMYAPEGWQLVPVKPTYEMLHAGDAELAYDCCSGTAAEAWPAMLAAAPKPDSTK